MIEPLKIDAFKQLAGTSLGATDWILLDQDKVNTFAEVTEDRQFIHIDPVAAKETIFGGTVVHGYFLLSLIPKFQGELLPKIEGTSAIVNYGLNKVRFIAPVKVGSRVRGQITMKEISERRAGQFLVSYEATLEIEGTETPAYTAEQLCLFITS